MEESKGSPKKLGDQLGCTTFNDTFDSNLTSLLTTYVGFNEVYCLMYLNKQMNHYLTKQNLDFIWKKQFEYEFPQINYPDHQKSPEENEFEFFKRSFKVYTRIRHILRNIFRLTD